MLPTKRCTCRRMNVPSSKPTWTISNRNWNTRLTSFPANCLSQTSKCCSITACVFTNAVTREELNNDVLTRFKQLLNGYWDSGAAKRYGLPTVKYFAEQICLSPNYFGDLIKSTTGKSAQERIQSQITDMAKEAILNPNLNTKQIAEMLGFQYPQHFLRFFKKQVGCTPKEYKMRSGGLP